MEDTAGDLTLPITEHQRDVLQRVAGVLRYVSAHINRAARRAVETGRPASEDDQHSDS